MSLSSSLFLTGPPRIGKSTLVSKVISYFRTNHPEISLRGFYTEQVTTTSSSSSKYEKRIGFDIITLDGNRGILARKSEYINNNNMPRVGDYFVNVEEFEKLAIPSILLHHHQNNEFNDSNKNEFKKKTLVITDEIGKMESFSKDFEDIVRNMIFNQKINNHNNNKICIFGTVALKFKGGLAEEIRNASSNKPFSSSTIFVGAGGSGGDNNNIKVSEITLQNRDKIFQIIINELKIMLEI
ncbi:hypothetical protein Glove_362g38 [Diversispora epigaea]|uniref:AAA+ ATPase domain-containing protein n=1 Tax=Diversispora epigaea TaxID=1348612 RepID=A0A397HDN8_9GLOM|nr:hypothetical protein Glove_362g38 [Diversispora epigaea]